LPTRARACDAAAVRVPLESPRPGCAKRDTMTTSIEIWSRGRTTPATLSDAFLFARVAETVAWCESLAPMAALGQRGSSALRQNLLHDGPDALLCSVGLDRQRQSHYRGLAVPTAPPLATPGRFMLHFPDENLTDGAAEVESHGFFDVFNLPPVDTWVSFFTEQPRPRSSRRYLLCYVPGWAIERADAGIEVNPEECIAWLDRSDVAVRRRVDAFVRTG